MSPLSLTAIDGLPQWTLACCYPFPNGEVSGLDPHCPPVIVRPGSGAADLTGGPVLPPISPLLYLGELGLPCHLSLPLPPSPELRGWMFPIALLPSVA